MLEATGYKVSTDYEDGAERCDAYTPKSQYAEVKHGEWISHEGYEECNQCHSKAIYAHDYCPNCGAKMGGKRKD
jgi:hypothetical protein